MQIIIDNEGVSGKIDTAFRIYGNKADLLALRDAINEQVGDSFGYGWVNVDIVGSLPDNTIYPFNEALAGKPVYPWKSKEEK